MPKNSILCTGSDCTSEADRSCSECSASLCGYHEIICHPDAQIADMNEKIRLREVIQKYQAEVSQLRQKLDETLLELSNSKARVRELEEEVKSNKTG